MGSRRRIERGHILEIDDQIATLTARRDELRKRQREEIGRICERAGLLDLDLAAVDLEAALRGIAARFRKQTVTDGAAAGAPRPADGPETKNGD